jgi:hypothetical protein
MKALYLVYKFDDSYYVDFQTGELYTIDQVKEHNMHIMNNFNECKAIENAGNHVWYCGCNDCIEYNKLLGKD